MTNYITTVLSTVLLSVVVAAPVAHQESITCGEITFTPGYTTTLCVEGSPSYTVGTSIR